MSALAPGPWFMPLSLLYRIGVGANNWLFDRGYKRREVLPVPVICIGNLSLGGTGKTPLVEYTARRLQAMGHRPAIISRGYKRKTHPHELVVVSDGQRILASAEEAGDEAYLLATVLPGIPVVVCADRARAARHALAQAWCDCILLDDGFQHRRLTRDVDFVLVDATVRLSGMRLFPGGTLREPIRALERATAVIHTRCDEMAAIHATANSETIDAMFPDLPQFRASFEVSGLTPLSAPGNSLELLWLKDRRVAAVAGIARPESFFSTLRKYGAEVNTFPQPDHVDYNPSLWKQLMARVAASGSEAIVMTAKDAVKVTNLESVVPIYVINRTTTLSDELAFTQILDKQWAGKEKAPGPGPGA